MPSVYHSPDPDLPLLPASGQDEDAGLPEGVRLLDGGALRLLEENMIARGGDPFPAGTKCFEFDQKIKGAGCLFLFGLIWLGAAIHGAGKSIAAGSFSFASMIPFLVGLFLLAVWFAKTSRRAWVVIEPERVRLRVKAALVVRDRSYQLQEIDAVAVYHQDGEFSVGLALESGGEAPLIAAGHDIYKASWLAGMLGRALGLRVDMGRHLVDESAVAGEKAGSAVTSPQKTVPAATGIAPPRRFALFSSNSPEFDGIVSRLGVNDAGPDDFAIRQGHFQIVMAAFLCVWLGGVLYGIILADDYFLWRLGTVARGEKLGDAAFELFFSCGWVLAFGSLLFTLFGSTWFVFLPDRLIICQKLLFPLTRKTIRRDAIAAVNRERVERKKAEWKLQILLTDGRKEELVSDSSNLRPDEFLADSGGRETKWMENIVLVWLDRTASADAARLAAAPDAPDALPPGVSILSAERLVELAAKLDPGGGHPPEPDTIGLEFILFPKFRRLYVVAEDDQIRYRKQSAFRYRTGVLPASELLAVFFGSTVSGGIQVVLEPKLGEDVELLKENTDSGRARWLAAYLSRRYDLPLRGDLAITGRRWGVDEFE